MKICTRCHKEWDHTELGLTCPECHTPATLDASEAAELFRRAVSEEQDKRYEVAVRLFSLLSEAGYPEGEEAYARCLEEGLGTPRDYVRAADGFLEAAEHGSVRAAYRLGRLLFLHSRIGVEHGRAAFWLRTAAALGSADAALMLSLSGERLGLSSAERLSYLDAAARGGSRKAVRRMARLYRLGKGVEKSPAAAVWFCRTLPHASRLSLLLYRIFYKNPVATEPAPITVGDPAAALFTLGEEATTQGFCTTALRLYLLATEAGSIEGALRAAAAYLGGVGTPPDRDAAFRLYARAEERGSAEAGLALGRIYEREERDLAEAERHYLIAAECGMAEHQYILGDFYINHDKAGEGVRRAVPWLRRAAEGGCRPAAERLLGIDAHLAETYNRAVLAQEEGNVCEAFALYENAAALGHADALSNLGYCLQKGIGCTADLRAAASAYRDAVAAGSEAAIINLAVCYMRGYGVNRSFQKARELLLSAPRPYREAAKKLLLEMDAVRDAKRAHRLYSAAAAVYHRGDVEGAIRLRLEAAKSGSARASYMIGCHFEFGDGVVPDRERAARWYESAANAGFLGGHARLKSGYLREKRKIGI